MTSSVIVKNSGWVVWHSDKILKRKDEVISRQWFTINSICEGIPILLKNSPFDIMRNSELKVNLKINEMVIMS